MNSIPERQNQEEQLKRLAAQRQLYSEAKMALAWQVILVVLVAAGLSFSATAYQGIQEWAAFLGLLISLLDASILEPRQRKLAQQAAKIQQAFDCYVFDMHWPETKKDSRPESIFAWADKYQRRDPGYSTLKNWYPAGVGQIPLAAARVICQRSSIWWDSELRRRYATIILVCLAAFTAIALIIGFSVGMTLPKFVYAIFAPLSPAFLWGIREYKKQRETANTLDRLMEQATSLWEKACKKTLPDAELEQASRALQNEIYDHRRTAPFIFDWIYNRLRKKSEEQMNKVADELVNQYLKSECD